MNLLRNPFHPTLIVSNQYISLIYSMWSCSTGYMNIIYAKKNGEKDIENNNFFFLCLLGRVEF